MIIKSRFVERGKKVNATKKETEYWLSKYSHRQGKGIGIKGINSLERMCGWSMAR